MKATILTAGTVLLASFAAMTATAQPKLVIKAFTIANGVQSPTKTFASGQIVAAPPSNTSSYVYYILQNTGNQTLVINPPNYGGCTNNVWSCESLPATILVGQTAPSKSMFFHAGSSSVTDGANNGWITFTSNAGSFSLNFQGIYVADPSMTIVSGDNINITSQAQPYTYQYPSTPVGTPTSRAFTFSNIPDNFVELIVNNYSLTQLQGNCFSLISGSFPGIVNSGSSLVFRWRMMSASAGTCKAKITFNTNKSIYPTFSWTLTGTVTP